MPKVTRLTGRDKVDFGFKSDLDVTPPAPERIMLLPPEPEKKAPGTVTKIEAETAAFSLAFKFTIEETDRFVYNPEPGLCIERGLK